MEEDIPLDPDGVPILAEIPRGRWSEVLKRFPHRVRKTAALRSGETWQEALMLVVELELEDPAPIGIATPAPPSVPPVERPTQRQMNIKLRGEQHDRLREAADRVGLAPTQLARLLVLRGVDAMLRSP